MPGPNPGWETAACLLLLLPLLLGPLLWRDAAAVSRAATTELSTPPPSDETVRTAARMPHFELGGSVSLSADQSFTSSFAQELARESSMVTADSVYKSSFAAEMLETSQAAAEASTEIAGAGVSDGDENNIYENVSTARLSLGSCVQDNVRQSLGSNSSFNFGRHSQVSICLLLLSRYQVTSEMSFQVLFVCSICSQLQ